MIPKINLHNKFINNTQTTKNQENFAHYFAENYLANHPVMFLQDCIGPWRFVTFRLSTGYYFFKKHSLVNVSHHTLTHHVIHIDNIL